MTCDNFKPLMMGYLDQELTHLEVIRMEQHLHECDECSSELKEFRKLKEVTHDMRVVTPDNKHWDEYWSNVYNRLERKIGWILISLGFILLASYGIYELLAGLFFHPGLPLLVRIGILALVVGFCTLLISVLRERLFLSKSDKYERVKR